MQKTFIISLLTVGGLALLAGVGLLAYRLGQAEKTVTNLVTSLPTSAPSPTLSPLVSPAVSPSPVLTLTPTVDEISLIKQAVFAKTGLDATRAEVTITQNTGQHAKGNIREFEAVGGGYWLAAKTDSGWIEVYDGQANPTCSQISPYNFPKTMIPECLDSTGRVVTR